MIPFGDLRRAYRRLRPEIDAAIAATLEHGRFILGERVNTFETQFAAYCSCRHAVGVASGTDALALALRAVGVAAGDEVITTPLSAAFTALAIAQIGAVPIFCDVEPEFLTLDPGQLERVLSPRARAVVPVHLYGHPAAMDDLLAVARRNGLAVVEDAAHAHGARWRGRRIGSLADAAAFSFYPTKNLGAFGDGGAVTTDDDGIARRVRWLRDGGQSTRWRHEIAGVNSRLDELQAAILSVRLANLDADNSRRRIIAQRYDDALLGSSVRTAQNVADAAEGVFHLYVVRSDMRDALAATLERDGVETAIHYPTPIHMQPAFGGARRAGECPVAESAASQVLSLPMYPELEDSEVEAVCAALHRQ